MPLKGQYWAALGYGIFLAIGCGGHTEEESVGRTPRPPRIGETLPDPNTTYEFPPAIQDEIIDVSAAPVAVVGVAGKKISYFSPQDQVIYTIAEFYVGRADHGDIGGDVILVRTLGGTIEGDIRQTVTHEPVFRYGERSRLFLTPLSDEELGGVAADAGGDLVRRASGVYTVFGNDKGKQDEPSLAFEMAAVLGCAASDSVCIASGYKWTTQPVAYKINPNTADIADEVIGTVTGFDAWEHDTTAAIDFNYVGATTATAYAWDYQNTVFWKNESGSGYAALTSIIRQGSSIIDFDVKFNDSLTWSTGAGGTSLQHVAMHESGHALGLDHVQDTTQIMYHTVTNLMTLGSGDLQGGRFLYPTPETPAVGDFNGDGKDDIVAFTRASNPRAWVSLSNGSQFGASSLWHNYFATPGETPMTGDFNGDGKDDIVTFTHGSAADVWVALSTGSAFGPGLKWHDGFASNQSLPRVGDVNGDGKDDIVYFNRNVWADAVVALSTGSAFAAASTWHTYFAHAGEWPELGDVNGDGKADLVVFTQGFGEDVYVALSTGSSFGTVQLWSSFFAPPGETPRVGYLPSDAKADIWAFVPTNGDVWVAEAQTSSFGSPAKKLDVFSVQGQTQLLGNFNASYNTRRGDVARFTHGSAADVFVEIYVPYLSGYGGEYKWHDYFTP